MENLDWTSDVIFTNESSDVTKGTVTEGLKMFDGVSANTDLTILSSLQLTTS